MSPRGLSRYAPVLIGVLVLSLIIAPTLKFTAKAAPALVIIASGLKTPTAIAVNSQQDIYFTDTRNKTIKEIPAGSINVKTIVRGTEPNIEAAAFDSKDNFWYAAFDSGNISEIPAGSTIPTFFMNIPGGGPVSLSVDNSSNLYAATFNQNEILKITPEMMVTVVARGDVSPLVESVAADSKGDVYFAYAGRVYEVFSGTATSYTYFNDTSSVRLYIDENGVLYDVTLISVLQGVSVLRFTPGSQVPEHILDIPNRPGGIAVRAGIMYLTFPDIGSIGKIQLPPAQPASATVNPVLIATTAAAVVALVVYLWARRRRFTRRTQPQDPSKMIDQT